MDDHSVKFHESLIWFRHDVHQLLSVLNAPQVEVEDWWRTMLKRLDAVASWQKLTKFQDIEDGHEHTSASGSVESLSAPKID